MLDYNDVPEKSKQRENVNHLNVAKCNLGKARHEPMGSAVLFVAVCDLWGGPQVLAGQGGFLFLSWIIGSTANRCRFVPHHTHPQVG